MPRISDHIVDCSIYLYPSEATADEGKGFGGSGFLVHVPSNVDGFVHLYAVTNKHIIDGDCGVLRLNRKDGGFDIITTQYGQWIPHSEGDDVVVMPLELGEAFKWWSVGTEMFVTREIVDAYRIGYGDDAFLVGRLIAHDGRQKNTPIVRFGNISLMADAAEPIKCGDREQESFLLECRSLSGFSGSPVFVTTTQVYRGDAAEKLAKSRGRLHGQVRNSLSEISGDGEITYENPNVKVVMLDIANAGPWLLGIDWGHIPLWRPVYKIDRETKTEYRVEANTGIACVVPAWRILDVLSVEELVTERKKEDERLNGSKTSGTLPKSTSMA